MKEENEKVWSFLGGHTDLEQMEKVKKWKVTAG